MITTVTGKNQVTIPAALARELDIEPGTRLDWARTEDGALLAKPKPSRAQLVRQLSGRGRRYLRPGSTPIRDLIGERAQDEVAEGLT